MCAFLLLLETLWCARLLQSKRTVVCMVLVIRTSMVYVLVAVEERTRMHALCSSNRNRVQASCSWYAQLFVCLWHFTTESCVQACCIQITFFCRLVAVGRYNRANAGCSGSQIVCIAIVCLLIAVVGSSRVLPVALETSIKGMLSA